MTKTMEEWKQEAEQKRNEERKKLLAISDYEAGKLPIPEWYQRIRYLREIEAAEWLANLQKTIPVQPQEEQKHTKYRKPFKAVVVKDRWGD